MSAASSQNLVFENVVPIGAKDGDNLVYAAPNEVDSTTLQVFLSGLFLTLGLDYELAPDNKTITIKLEPSDPTRLNVPPCQNEPFRIFYARI